MMPPRLAGIGAVVSLLLLATLVWLKVRAPLHPSSIPQRGLARDTRLPHSPAQPGTSATTELLTADAGDSPTQAGSPSPTHRDSAEEAGRLLGFVHSLDGMEGHPEREHAFRRLLDAMRTDPAALDHVVAAAQNQTIPSKRRLAIVALGRVKSGKAAAILWGLARSQSEEDQSQAIRAVGVRSGPGNWGHLIRRIL